MRNNNPRCPNPCTIENSYDIASSICNQHLYVSKKFMNFKVADTKLINPNSGYKRLEKIL